MAKCYCGPCDEMVSARGRECPRCGADTDKVDAETIMFIQTSGPAPRAQLPVHVWAVEIGQRMVDAARLMRNGDSNE